MKDHTASIADPPAIVEAAEPSIARRLDLIFVNEPDDGPNSNWVILLCSTAVFLIALEITIISVALPQIESAFPDSSRATLSWVFTAYNVGVASLMLIAGWLCERDGRKHIFVTGMAVFGAGSVITGLAPHVAFLIGGRVVQSIGGAMLVPASLALILHSVRAEQKNTAIAVWGSMAAIAAAVGPTLGALLVEAAGWRWVFLINVPIVVAAVITGRKVLEDSRDPHANRTADLLGAPIGAAGIGALVYAIVIAGTQGITSFTVLAATAVAVTCLAVFIVRTRQHASPVFPPSLAVVPTYRVGAIGTLFFGAGFAGWLVMAPTFLVQVWDYSIVQAGFGVAPMPAVMAITAPPAGKICARFGYRWVVALGSLAALAATALWIATVPVEPSYTATFLPGCIMLGIGMGIALPMLTAASMHDVPPDSYAVGAAGNTTVRQVAMAIGISIAVSVVGSAASATDELSAFRQSWMVCGLFFLATSVAFAALYPTITHDPEQVEEPILDLRLAGPDGEPVQTIHAQ